MVKLVEPMSKSAPPSADRDTASRGGTGLGPGGYTYTDTERRTVLDTAFSRREQKPTVAQHAEMFRGINSETIVRNCPFPIPDNAIIDGYPRGSLPKQKPQEVPGPTGNYLHIDIRFNRDEMVVRDGVSRMEKVSYNVRWHTMNSSGSSAEPVWRVSRTDGNGKFSLVQKGEGRFEWVPESALRTAREAQRGRDPRFTEQDRAEASKLLDNAHYPDRLTRPLLSAVQAKARMSGGR